MSIVRLAGSLRIAARAVPRTVLSRRASTSPPASASSSFTEKKTSPLLLIVPVISAGLGTWQVFRKEEKEKHIAFIESRMHGEPAPLPDV